MNCKLVIGRADRASVRRFFETKFPSTRLGWPTVACWADNGTLVGAISTVPKRDVLVAGPILASEAMVDNVPVLAALVKSYESILQQAGVNKYLFSVERSNERWITMLSNHKGVQPYAVDEGNVFFQRVLAPQARQKGVE